MSRAIMHSRAISINLSLTVRVTDERRGETLLAVPLLPLTMLALFIWRVRLGWNRLRYELTMLRQDVSAALEFTAIVLLIGVKAAAFGLGVPG